MGNPHTRIHQCARCLLPRCIKARRVIPILFHSRQHSKLCCLTNLCCCCMIRINHKPLLPFCMNLISMIRLSVLAYPYNKRLSIHFSCKIYNALQFMRHATKTLRCNIGLSMNCNCNAKILPDIRYKIQINGILSGRILIS